jgi:hypothetical protein
MLKSSFATGKFDKQFCFSLGPFGRDGVSALYLWTLYLCHAPSRCHHWRAEKGPIIGGLLQTREPEKTKQLKRPMTCL